MNQQQIGRSISSKQSSNDQPQKEPVKTPPNDSLVTLPRSKTNGPGVLFDSPPKRNENSSEENEENSTNYSENKIKTESKQELPLDLHPISRYVSVIDDINKERVFFTEEEEKSAKMSLVSGNTRTQSEMSNQVKFQEEWADESNKTKGKSAIYGWKEDSSRRWQKE